MCKDTFWQELDNRREIINIYTLVIQENIFEVRVFSIAIILNYFAIQGNSLIFNV